jgi:hypothetical protein
MTLSEILVIGMINTQLFGAPGMTISDRRSGSLTLFTVRHGLIWLFGCVVWLCQETLEETLTLPSLTLVLCGSELCSCGLASADLLVGGTEGLTT